MQKIKYKQSVYTGKQTEQGYIMLEALLSILLLIILLSWLSQIFLLWQRHDEAELPMFTHFHHIIELESQLSKKVSVSNNQVHFLQISGDMVTISFHNNKIRRQVNGSGHEELLRSITHFTAIENEKDIVINILTNSGEQFEKSIRKEVE